MKRNYRRAALHASVAAITVISGAESIMAAQATWMSPHSAPPVAIRQDTQAVAPAPVLVSSRSGLADGSYTGPAVDAYYGLVQVRVSIRGGRLVSVDVLRYPDDRGTSRFINSQALPMLQNEVIQAQSAHVWGISGATLTSQAYLRSVDAALRKAGA